MVFDVKYDKEQFKDPMTIGLLLYRLSRERAKTNELYSRILEKLDQINSNISSKTTGEQHSPLSEVDEKPIDSKYKEALARFSEKKPTIRLNLNKDAQTNIIEGINFIDEVTLLSADRSGIEKLINEQLEKYLA